MKSSQHGFTLVELSIVLVILGLLVGGVLTGQSLIRAAELRSVTAQSQRYQAAVMTFRDKYFALPGDMTNATTYWGTATNCPGTSSQGSTTAATCNGNGDGIILPTSTSNESFRFWQHLANAGLIEGNYSGVDGAATGYTAIASNSPAGRISGSLWFVYNWGYSTSQPDRFDGQYDNGMEVGMINSSGDPSFPLFKPEDAYNIDTKLDDGKPATGKLVMRANFTSYNCTNTSTSSNLSATYLLTNTALACALVFRQAF